MVLRHWVQIHIAHQLTQVIILLLTNPLGGPILADGRFSGAILVWVRIESIKLINVKLVILIITDFCLCMIIHIILFPFKLIQRILIVSLALRIQNYSFVGLEVLASFRLLGSHVRHLVHISKTLVDGWILRSKRPRNLLKGHVFIL